MPIPDFQSLMLPVLEFYGDKLEHGSQDALGHLKTKLKLSDEEINELLPSGRQFRFNNRVGWAIIYLKKYGLLNRPSRDKKMGFLLIFFTFSAPENTRTNLRHPPPLKSHLTTRFIRLCKFSKYFSHAPKRFQQKSQTNPFKGRIFPKNNSDNPWVKVILNTCMCLILL
ncbi:MAG: winged helix-turn-helix domain-containing protein [Methanoregula sp.]|nr:winged helix-turn-helix domain-containing protein [Methanoregula sp.]